MKKLYFTVGPSQLYPTVAKHTAQAMKDQIMSLSHRSETFKELFQKTQNNLRKLLNIPKDHSIFFLSSATECWERIIENCVDKTTFHIVGGAFSSKFYKASLGFQKKATKFEFNGKNWSDLKIPKKNELIAITQNETSNGLMIPMDKIYEIGKQNPDSLIALDIVSSVPYPDIDFNKVDCTFFSVQKGFGLPAGLAILIVSPKAMEKAKKLEEENTPLTSFRRFSVLKKYADKNQTFETPNVFLIYLLSKITEDMLKQGLTKIRADIDQKSKLLYKFIEQSTNYSFTDINSIFKSKTVMVLDVKGGSPNLLSKLKKKGIIVGAGYELMKDKQLRIANFPALSIGNIKKLISEISKN